MSQISPATETPVPMQQGEDIEFDQFIEGLTPQTMKEFVADMMKLRAQKGKQDGNL